MASYFENERTFLVNEVPADLLSSEPVEIVDLYVPQDPGVHPRVRLRREGARHELTKKTPTRAGDASQHLEQTIELSVDEFDALAIGNRRLEKLRYDVVIGGYRAQLDVFTGMLAGLVLIDFEFSSRAELEAFTPPAVCGPDVTQEDFIAGGRLAGRRLAEIEGDLARVRKASVGRARA